MGDKVEAFLSTVLDTPEREGFHVCLDDDGAARQLPASLRLLEGRVGILAAEEAAEGEASKPRRFAMSPAYSGAVVDTWWGRFVIDLAGMDVGPEVKPILREHIRDRAVGHSDSIKITDAGVEIEGNMSRTSRDGVEVAGLADEGFPFQASIGFDIGEVYYLSEDEARDVNGGKFEGPGYVATKTFLRESSFVALGADKDTASVVLADHGNDGRLVEVVRREVADQEVTMGDATAATPAAPADKPEGLALLAELRETFPDDQEFALKMFDAGHDVATASVKFAALVQARAEEKAEADAARIAELEAASEKPTTTGAAPLRFVAGEARDAAVADAPNLTGLEPDERAAAEWAANHNDVRAEFSSVEAYAAFLRADNSGRVRIYRPGGDE